MSTETPKQKAERLGVPLIPTPIRKTKTPKEDKSKDYKDFFVNKIEAICESCGKEIKILDKREPCASQDCPFGILTF